MQTSLVCIISYIIMFINHPYTVCGFFVLDGLGCDIKFPNFMWLDNSLSVLGISMLHSMCIMIKQQGESLEMKFIVVAYYSVS